MTHKPPAPKCPGTQTLCSARYDWYVNAGTSICSTHRHQNMYLCIQILKYQAIALYTLNKILSPRMN